MKKYQKGELIHVDDADEMGLVLDRTKVAMHIDLFNSTTAHEPLPANHVLVTMLDVLVNGQIIRMVVDRSDEE